MTEWDRYGGDHKAVSYVPESILVRQTLFACFVLGGQTSSSFFFVKTFHKKALLPAMNCPGRGQFRDRL